jgi:hypothetical protein
MKKFFAFLIVSAALVACGGKTETSESAADTTATVVETPVAADTTTVSDTTSVAGDTTVVK